MKPTAKSIAQQKWVQAEVRRRLQAFVGRSISSDELNRLQAEVMAEFERLWPLHIGSTVPPPKNGQP